MEDGGWRMEDRRWKVEDGGRRVEEGPGSSGKLGTAPSPPAVGALPKHLQVQARKE